MHNTLENWHDRYLRQARWTASLRSYLYARAALAPTSYVLDVGCGTGALLGELSEYYGKIFGLDLEFERTRMAMRRTPNARLSQADAQCMPYAPGSFDLVLCHFLLLWVPDPFRVVSEMARLTHHGGIVMVLAEPDYGGRIDYPQTLEQLGTWQIAALRQQGADPFIGRRLASLLRQAGLVDVETGVLGGQWISALSIDDIQNEWDVLCADLSDNLEFSRRQESFRQEYFSAFQEGKGVLFVPTFYAIGRKARDG